MRAAKSLKKDILFTLDGAAYNVLGSGNGRVTFAYLNYAFQIRTAGNPLRVEVAPAK